MTLNFTIGIPQAVLLGLYGLSLAICIEQHGEPREPLNACMACGCSVVAVSPSYSPDDRGCIAYGYPHFERGNRKNHYKEV